MPSVFGGGGGARWVPRPTGRDMSDAFKKGRRRRQARQDYGPRPDEYQKHAEPFGPPDEFELDKSEPFDEDPFELDTSESVDSTHRLLIPPPPPPAPSQLHLHRAYSPHGGSAQLPPGGFPQSWEKLFLSGTRASLDSSWLKAAQYVAWEQHLKIWFLDGYSVKVLEVSEGEAASFFNAPSFGTWYYTYVLGPNYYRKGSTQYHQPLKRWLVGA